MHSGMDGDFRSKVVGEEARETHRELLVPSAASVRDINSQSRHRSPGRLDALLPVGWASATWLALVSARRFSLGTTSRAAHTISKDLIKVFAP